MSYPELEQLRDIHLPDPIGWWPPSTALWVTLLIATILTLLGLFFIVRTYRQGALRRAALKELRRIEIEDREGRPKSESLNAIATLLRRICLSRFPPQTVAGLTGQAWLTFLDHAFDPSGRSNHFRDGHGSQLETERFKESAEGSEERAGDNSGDHSLQGVLTLTQRWIKKTC